MLSAEYRRGWGDRGRGELGVGEEEDGGIGGWWETSDSTLSSHSALSTLHSALREALST
uniref:Uncharacterized protein n=1 Tax=Desertifilum tharense IPPAS B-1220 TaxID=1781255 RepID=A0ACD5GRI9_9CYAN